MNIHITCKDGITILKPSGKLILDAVSELRQVIDAELVAGGGNPKLLVDFADVSMIGSAGLGILMQVHVSMIKNGGRLCYCQHEHNYPASLNKEPLDYYI